MNLPFNTDTLYLMGSKTSGLMQSGFFIFFFDELVVFLLFRDGTNGNTIFWSREEPKGLF